MILLKTWVSNDLVKIITSGISPTQNMNAKFNADGELIIRGNSQWACVSNVNSLNKGNTTSYPFISPISCSAGLKHFTTCYNEHFISLIWNNTINITQSSC